MKKLYIKERKIHEASASCILPNIAYGSRGVDKISYVPLFSRMGKRKPVGGKGTFLIQNRSTRQCLEKAWRVWFYSIHRINKTDE